MIGYFGCNHFHLYKAGQAFLLGMSLWFYGYFNPSYLPIILVSILLNYIMAGLMAKTDVPRLRKLELIAAIVANLAVLFYYKYFDFAITNINLLCGTDFNLLNILLPLGISFFTFQQISFVVDAYRGEVNQCDFLQYASFVVYFPQLIAGPIVTHDELIPQFEDLSKKSFNWENFSPGLFLFVLGLSKKILIADVFGEAVNWGFGNVMRLDATNALLVIFAYTFQVYFDFSGYCDMAIGIGKMMNLDLPLNFNSPYKAVTITEFWQRWHMTLTRFFTKYVYIPLGGNRKGNLRTYRNIMIVYFVSGIWHGANWTFILWGALHGIASVLTRRFESAIKKMPRWICWMLTALFLNFTWLFFRADSIGQGVELLAKAFSMEFGPVSQQIFDVFNLMEIVHLVRWTFNTELPQICGWLMPALFYVGALLLVLFAPNAYEKMKNMKCTLWELTVISILLIWCIFSLSGVSTFLYFNF